MTLSIVDLAEIVYDLVWFRVPEQGCDELVHEGLERGEKSIVSYPLSHAGPELLDGVQARGIGREEKQLHLPAQAPHKVAGGPRAVRGPVV